MRTNEHESPERLFDFAMDQVSDQARDSVAMHAASCPYCMTRIQSFRSLQRVLSAPAAPEGLVDAAYARAARSPSDSGQANDRQPAVQHRTGEDIRSVLARWIVGPALPQTIRPAVSRFSGALLLCGALVLGGLGGFVVTRDRSTEAPAEPTPFQGLRLSNTNRLPESISGPAWYLLTMAPVQREIKLSSRQQEEFRAARERTNSKLKSFRATATGQLGHPGNLRILHANLRILREQVRILQEAENRSMAILTPEQRVRFDQMMVQAQAPFVLLRRDIRSILRLSDHQVRKIANLNAEMRREEVVYTAPIIRKRQSMSEQRRKVVRVMKQDSLRTNRAIFSVLTPDQLERWKRAVGPAVPGLTMLGVPTQ